MSLKLQFTHISLLFVLILSLSACSSQVANNNSSSNGVVTTQDPFENINRKIFYFNETVDHLILKPPAIAYKAITPRFVDKGIGNFFSNLGDVKNALNNLLQFKFKDAISDTERFIFNSTFGLGGFLDIASAAGIEKHNEDFGQTLATWGVKSGPYLMLPLLGPSTVRDGIAKVTVDSAANPASYSDENLALFAIETVKKRSDLFIDEDLLASLSDDKYAALRDVWLQNRKSLINDGKVIESDDGSDLIDELESLDSE